VSTIELDTPAVVVDVDRLQRNLERWQAHCDAVGLASRPHVKTHKSVEIARRQIALGARGITCQKLGEAEVMAAAGIDDILLPYNLLGPAKLERLAALAARVDVAVTVDDVRLLEGLARAARSSREIRVLVECDTGLGRVGVATPAAAASLATSVARSNGLRFGGFLTYPAPDGAREFLAEAARLAESAGLAVETISAGGTPAMWSSAELRPTVTEYRVGTYAFHDRATVAAGAATLDEVALTVCATVVSRPRSDRAILDAGSKTLAHDPGPGPGHGTILEAPASVVERLNEEHAIVALAPGETLELGQQVRIVPNHVCVVVNLADELVVLGDGRAQGVWRVDARGRSR
jgi:D-serine deaminase-like pyridoxal phosphate-dependent protein